MLGSAHVRTSWLLNKNCLRIYDVILSVFFFTFLTGLFPSLLIEENFHSSVF